MVTSVDSLTEEFSRVNFDEIEMEGIATKIATLHEELARLAARVPEVPKIEEFREVRVTIKDVKDISLEMFKCLPTFGGEREQYPYWRQTATGVMKIFEGFTVKPKYFEALNIVRAKIIGTASKTLTNYNTVLNFNAIQ